jgi:hypothetical protein
MLWPILYRLKQEIFFAHTSFKWENNAAHNAGVTCVIVGLAPESFAKAVLYEGDVSRTASSIGPYLVPSSDVIVGGNLIFSKDEVDRIVGNFPEAARLFRRLEGAKEFIQGSMRWCLWIDDDHSAEAVAIAPLRERIERVRRVRTESRGKQANDAASAPHRFVYAPHRQGLAILVPFVSSERRHYLPCGLFNETTVIVAPNQAIYDASVWCLSVLSSRLHLVWIATVGGKLETRIRYSNILGWNTFPVPTLTEKNKLDLIRCAEDILLAREAHFPATIADLYDPDNMPADLREAHERNDEVVERIYIGRQFRNDTERLEKLFDLYTKMIAANRATKNKPKAGASA